MAMTYLARRPALDLRREIDQLFDSFLSPGRGVEGIPLSLEMTETEGAYKISAEVPGISPNEVDLQIDQGILTIRGEKRRETSESMGGIEYSERSYGSFARSVQLPPGADPSKVEAKLEDGVLTIEVPKGEGSRPRKIPLGTSQQQQQPSQQQPQREKPQQQVPVRGDGGKQEQKSQNR